MFFKKKTEVEQQLAAGSGSRKYRSPSTNHQQTQHWVDDALPTSPRSNTNRQLVYFWYYLKIIMINTLLHLIYNFIIK